MAKSDKFGRPFVNVACKDRKGNGYCAGVVRIGAQLFKVEPGESKTDGVMAWVRITKLDAQRSGGFGGGGNGGGGGGRGGYGGGGSRGGGL
jgi:uncharacterized membrane protein YgcG